MESEFLSKLARIAFFPGAFTVNPSFALELIGATFLVRSQGIRTLWHSAFVPAFGATVVGFIAAFAARENVAETAAFLRTGFQHPTEGQVATTGLFDLVSSPAGQVSLVALCLALACWANIRRPRWVGIAALFVAAEVLITSTALA